MRANVIGRPSMVTDADAPISCSARGNTDAAPAPRQTFTVGTSWRILLQAQRNAGKLRNEPFWKVTSLSGDGGKPCIQPRDSGSVSAAVGVEVGWFAADATDIDDYSGEAIPISYHAVTRRTSRVCAGVMVALSGCGLSMQ